MKAFEPDSLLSVFNAHARLDVDFIIAAGNLGLLFQLCVSVTFVKDWHVTMCDN